MDGTAPSRGLEGAPLGEYEAFLSLGWVVEGYFLWLQTHTVDLVRAQRAGPSSAESDYVSSVHATRRRVQKFFSNDGYPPFEIQ